ncbi:unnamed protein product [Ectocarpus sp. 13 AM-2016]
MVKYVSKVEKRSPAAADVFVRAISRADDDADEAQTVLRSIFLNCTGERDISARETARLLLGNKLCSSSFSFVRLVVDPSTSTRQINLDGAAREGALKKSMRDLYAGRRSVIDKYPSIMDVSFFVFHQLYTRDLGGRITARDGAGSLVVIKLPALPCSLGNARHLEACRNNLVAHRPWEDEPRTAYRDMVAVTDLDVPASISGQEPKLALLWDAFVQANPDLPELRFGDMLAGRLSLARREAAPTAGDDDDNGLLLDQPDDWMDVANMRRRGAAREEQEVDTRGTPTTTWPAPERLRSKMSWREGERIPHVAPDSLNERQRNCYDVVMNHFENERSEPPHIMVLGTAGAGKSYLVYALSKLLGGFLRRAALTGMAGFLIAGSTLHSLPGLPVRQGRNLHGQSLKALQKSLTDVKYIITDELSMVSQSQME